METLEKEKLSKLSNHALEVILDILLDEVSNHIEQVRKIVDLIKEIVEERSENK
jgi:uncharacterized membrane protein YheB (UPF0754 family)